jgi:hypothetical protein
MAEEGHELEGKTPRSQRPALKIISKTESLDTQILECRARVLRVAESMSRNVPAGPILAHLESGMEKRTHAEYIAEPEENCKMVVEEGHELEGAEHTASNTEIKSKMPSLECRARVSQESMGRVKTKIRDLKLEIEEGHEDEEPWSRRAKIGSKIFGFLKENRRDEAACSAQVTEI